MQIIKHRCNEVSQLKGLAKNFGIEIDLRSVVDKQGELHLSHDAWVKGENFEIWLNEYQKSGLQGPLILNTKEDGLEAKTLELLGKYQITNFFFLDTALPTMVKWTVKENKRFFAVRWSKYEPVEFCEKFKNLCEWVWVDCFFLEIPPAEVVKKLKNNFKVCLVSPELQGGDVQLIAEFKKQLPSLDAVCTKRPDLWDE